MKYQSYLSLNILHDYYPSGICTDFTVTPTVECEKMLKGYRLLIKYQPNGFRLSVGTDDAGKPLVAIPQNQLLQFELRQNNSGFANYTVLPPGAGPFVFAVAPGDSRLLVGGLLEEDQSDTFIVKEESGKTRFQLSRRPVTGFTRMQFSVSGLGGRTVLSYDEKTAVVTLNTRDKIGKKFGLTYQVPVRVAPDLFGLVQLAPPKFSGDTNGLPAEFVLSFEAFRQLWRYYLIAADNNGKTPDYQVVDGNSARSEGPLVFKKATDLVAKPDPQDRIAVKLASQYPQANRYRFESDEPIPFRKLGRKDLQLKRNKTVLIGHLPSPKPENQAIHIIKFL